MQKTGLQKFGKYSFFEKWAELLTYMCIFLLFHNRNMDSLVFAEFCEHLTEELQRDEAKQNGVSSELVPMHDLVGDSDANMNDEKPPIPSSKGSTQGDDPEDDLLRLTGDGNYLQPKKESVI